MNITQCLEAQKWKWLRAICRTHGLPFDSNTTKEQAVHKLIPILTSPQVLQATWDETSAEARAALRALAENGGQMSRAEFIARFGPIRPYKPWRDEAPKRPWQMPISPAEVLAYRGLTFAVNLGTTRRPSWAIVLPDEIHSELAVHLGQPLTATLPLVPASPAPGPDITTDIFAFLAFLNRRDVRPLHSRWLPPTEIRCLAPYLTGLDSLPDGVRSERQVPYLAFIHYLAERAGLVGLSLGLLKPTLPARDWLRRPRAERIQRLWEAWCGEDKDNKVWLRYQLPAVRNDEPLPRFHGLLKALATCEPGHAYPLDDFLNALRRFDPALFQPYADSLWTGDAPANFHDAATTCLRSLLTGPLAWFGVLESASQRTGESAIVSLSPLGAALLGRGDGEWPQEVTADAHAPLLSVRFDAQGEAPALIVEASPTLPLPDRFTLEGIVPPQLDAPGRYRLTRQRFLRALQRGHSLESILDLLERNTGDTLRPIELGTLYRWAEDFEQVRIYPALLMVVRDPALLRELCAVRRIRQKLGQTLSARAITVDASRLDQLLRQLNKRGIVPQLERPPTTGDAEPSLSPADRVSIVAALHCAALLRDALGLDFHLPFPLVRDWQEALSQAERDAVFTLLNETERRLREYSPSQAEYHPPFPITPLLPILEEAIARRATVEIEYHPAGDRPVTVRRVDPLRLEQRGRRGTVYLIAFCHLRGEERTFRVDRIATVRGVANPSYEV
ncbi:MAG TPA: WYL domain-containing protein [Anaerolineae bacterium]|nr:WYL domain-containing protein [Anaerolineae bacterium]